MRLVPLAASLIVGSFLAGCNEPLTMAVTSPEGTVVQKVVTGDVKLGGKTVSLETLQHGREGFVRNCYACHGLKGDGKGPSSAGLRPPPRDFTLGTFKFAAVSGGSLPNDEDLVRIVKGGLHGTAMLEWNVPDPDLASIIQYIKTFSARWQDESPGDPIKPGPDPYGEAGKAKAIERGKGMYHVTAQCASCHPNYVMRDELVALTKQLKNVDLTEFRPDMYDPVLKESDYGVKLLPPDFLRSDVRSGSTLNDLYRTIASGVGGTAMPTWKGSFPEEDLWALAYYVHSLIELKDTPGARALRQKLISQPPPPPPPPEAPEGAAPSPGTPTPESATPPAPKP